MLKIVQIIIGTVLTVLGLIIAPLPPPFAFGVPMLIIGLALLAPHVRFVQRFIRSLRRRSPTVNKTMIKYRDKFPKIVKTTIDQTNPEEE